MDSVSGAWNGYNRYYTTTANGEPAALSNECVWLPRSILLRATEHFTETGPPTEYLLSDASYTWMSAAELPADFFSGAGSSSYALVTAGVDHWVS